MQHDYRVARSKRLATNDILTHYQKHGELVELACRVEAIEERLEQKR
jgi:hypothetical protein